MAMEAQGVAVFWSATTTISTAVPIGCVTDFTGPGGAAATIDVTCLSATDAKAFLIGLRDEGELQLGMNYIATDAGQTALITDRAARAKRHWSIELKDPTSHRIHGKGYCMNFSVQGSVDNAIKAQATIRISGPASYDTCT